MMICKKIPICENKEEVFMEAYILHNSVEFNHNLKRPVALIIPGGAYISTSDREAEQVALAFATHGYHAFVLRYSIGKEALMPQPILEGFKAISIIRDHADEWCVDVNRIVPCGFSAGGHLAASLATMWNLPEFANALGCSSESIKPNAVVLSYPCVVVPNHAGSLDTGMPAEALEAFKANPMMSELNEALVVKDGTIRLDLIDVMYRNMTGKPDWKAEDLQSYSTDLLVSEDTVPSFVWATENDILVPVSGAIQFVQAMLKNGRRIEFHLFAGGEHGLSLAKATTAGSPNMVNDEVAVWFNMAIAFLAKTLD
ncbi:alpha/beta hydrolase [Paenibacillus riograndensis]|uniref:BD-FAE-like domain-containing protein n=1 Tax=Paenibacillus riograndensis SBR5 TaxID=1073571 RepID=A0A0E3WIX7_9BACL|nr:alpha/beta hydrolase [Paenibacillus riograndensis]CQR57808.1 hypothetical protein PRIO_5419 [Paenibacillus riograndensis SBR5]